MMRTGGVPRDFDAVRLREVACCTAPLTCSVTEDRDGDRHGQWLKAIPRSQIIIRMYGIFLY